MQNTQSNTLKPIPGWNKLAILIRSAVNNTPELATKKTQKEVMELINKHIASRGYLPADNENAAYKIAANLIEIRYELHPKAQQFALKHGKTMDQLARSIGYAHSFSLFGCYNPSALRHVAGIADLLAS